MAGGDRREPTALADREAAVMLGTGWLSALGAVLVAAGAQALEFTWEELAPLPVSRGGHAAAWLDGRLIVMGGTTWQGEQKRWLSQVEAYAARSRAWETIGQLPHPLADAAAAERRQQRWLIGGADRTTTFDTVWRVRLDGDRLVCIPDQPLPEPRAYASAQFVGSALHVIGGATDANNLSTARPTQLIRSSPTEGTPWRRGPDLPAQPRVLAASAVLQGAIYLFGGCYQDGAQAVRNLAETWRYDPRLQQWRRCADAPWAARGWEAVALDGRRALLLGGYVASPEEDRDQGPEFGFSDRVLLYDATTDRFERLGQQPMAAIGSAPVLHEGVVYLTGGEQRKRGRTERCFAGRLRGGSRLP